MSKYEQLCESYRASVERLLHYKSDCFSFAYQFFEGLKKYLEIPEMDIKFHLGNEPDNITKDCTLKEAMLLREDGCYLITFSLTLKASTGSEIVLIPFKFRKIDEGYTIYMLNLRQEFNIQHMQQLVGVYDFIFTELKNFYEQDLFADQGKKIGFLARNFT